MTRTHLALLLAAAVAAGCGADTPPRATPASSTSTTGGAPGEPASPLACGHWANIRTDINDGVLTDAEVREKLSEVESSANGPAVRAAARRLRAGVTSGPSSEIAAGIAALDRACRD